MNFAEDVPPIIIEEGCGGSRLEVEWKETRSRRKPVVQNYEYV